MTTRDGEVPSVDGGDEGDRVPIQDRPDGESTPFRPVSEMSAREWQAARREVQRRWPKQNRYAT
ncbi:MAG TPA: hypothetical protein VG674_30230 [Amycolatopsis sp.]|nr:hypothetical protein [Amycolatopsis sp.]